MQYLHLHGESTSSYTHHIAHHHTHLSMYWHTHLTQTLSLHVSGLCSLLVVCRCDDGLFVLLERHSLQDHDTSFTLTVEHSYEHALSCTTTSATATSHTEVQIHGVGPCQDLRERGRLVYIEVLSKGHRVCGGYIIEYKT